ncbi:transporter [Geothermobacter hydrogeniphilus]|uniref:MetA-pathway of phenol degradation n=1 Tax=Geothermobacter hydrogeniphilus TaxID=1969733 RepID=A0A1X0Y5V7_9BACT|nr:transporter [Geothermobacter hydrogeniphilus]ORJ60507.1 hypothetical protein B5V00_08060 [Geothermobacter hydrogeniphilus]
MTRIYLSILAVLLTALPVSARGLSLEVGLDVTSGDYGTDETVTGVTIPLTVSYSAERYSLAVTLPWVSQSKGTTIFMGGRRFDNGVPGTIIGGGGMGGRRIDTTESNSGLGDASLDADLVLWRPASGPEIRLLGYLKAPTGDDDKGLGTGAWDFGGGLSARQDLGDWFLDGSLRAIFPGENGDFQPDQYWDWTASVGRYQGEHLWFSGGLEGATAPYDGGDNALEVVGRCGWDGEGFGFGGHLLAGLSNGSPDIGGGVFAYRSF